MSKFRLGQMDEQYKNNTNIFICVLNLNEILIYFETTQRWLTDSSIHIFMWTDSLTKEYLNSSFELISAYTGTILSIIKLGKEVIDLKILYKIQIKRFDMSVSRVCC